MIPEWKPKPMLECKLIYLAGAYSDEQMSKEWSFSLLNDEQKNTVG